MYTGLSAILWKCSPTVYNNSIQRMYLIFGLSATTQEMLSAAQGAE